ncbi:MAG TPA: AI-2E family transporter [Vicinamibacterales bacterium]|nr:AI-2E family transporter [Vicinamibacterales bacterium]
MGEEHHILTGTRGVEPARAPLPPTKGAPEEPPPTVVDVNEGPGLAIAIVAAIALVYLLQWTQSVLIPVVIGILVAYAMEPLVSTMERAKIPRSVGAAAALVMLVGVLSLGTYSLSGQALQIVRQVPEAAQRIRERVRNRTVHTGALGEVQKAATELQRTAEVASAQSEPKRDPSTPPVQRVEIVEPAFDARSYLYWGGMNLLGATGQFAVVLFLVYFFLVTGDLYKRKIVKIAGPALWQKKLTVQILDEINMQISSFIRVQVLTSALVAVATGVALYFLGVQQYIIWGLLAGIFNSIPYLGPVLVSGGLAIVAFIQFNNIEKTVLVCTVAFLITSLEGFLLTPALMGRAARMNPVAIFVGLLFWSWIWGVWGAVLAVPMLMMIKAVSDHVEDLQPLAELLGE